VSDLISVIVTTYNRADALSAVLSALARQSDRDFEIVVADDGSTDDTADMLARWQTEFGEKLIHVWQAHDGFRAGEMRNRAVLASHGGYCIFLDGDCIPRPDFIAAHRALAEPGQFVAGNRTLLSPELTQDVLARNEAAGSWPFTTLLVHRLRGRANRIAPMLSLPLGPLRKLRGGQWRGARSCNLAVWRADLDRIDGFDAAFTGWGREDSDLFVRLINAGVSRKDGSFATGVLHLWHPPADMSRLPVNDDLLDAVIARRAIRAERGLSALAREADGVTPSPPAA
jgi:glycosyltransferase involved in cell wall biosynthesis